MTQMVETPPPADRDDDIISRLATDTVRTRKVIQASRSKQKTDGDVIQWVANVLTKIRLGRKRAARRLQIAHKK
jgi:hypothetical protein